MTVRALEFYCGIGGLHFALSRSSLGGTVVRAFDWDQSACRVYKANHSNVVTNVDISTLAAADLAAFKADLWLLSPACQPYTILNPKAKDSSDPRAQSFLHLIQDVLPELESTNQHPQRLLVENVAGFETSATRQILVSILHSLGYSTLELLLTPLQFGIPNSRLRYYLLAKKASLSFPHVDPRKSDKLGRCIPGRVDWLDLRLDPDAIDHGSPTNSVVYDLRRYLDRGYDPREVLVPDKVLKKWGRLFDIVLPSSRRTCCFTRGYTQLVERSGSVLQKNEILDVQPEAVKILHPLGLRYFSPEELLRLFDFNPCDPLAVPAFHWPDDISTKTRYRLIGNSVNIRVIQELIEYLFED
ncbi:hypothetical protein K443DRAFT_97071 [Laccaria amethystina LaAM-08-1]|uniref:tRNA (cytosine(38)-C(5))-methyltransferase n=1 Tax=Laccaria amethystina LaAM-08-1 TaxID=1095629 RepID=A0A0C9XBU4_9AGAR|nr:hypothetical protein K443DRAFT_97071 [Laccaria amethystina LaAM-08-1]